MSGASYQPRGSLTFFYGPMDCGKSLLALQLDYNRTREGLRGLLLTRFDRSAAPQISSRVGVSKPAVDVVDDTDVRELVSQARTLQHGVDYLIVDEAQFLTEQQIEQLAELADLQHLEVSAFGIATDFTGRLFRGSARLFELADEALPLQVEVFCWCGRPAKWNARVVAGQVVRSGEQIVVADTTSIDAPPQQNVHYRVLCRHHFRAGDLGAS